MIFIQRIYFRLLFSPFFYFRLAFYIYTKYRFMNVFIEWVQSFEREKEREVE